MNEFLQQNLRDVGVNVELMVIEWNALLVAWRGGAKDPANRGWQKTAMIRRLREAELLQADRNFDAAALLVSEARVGLEKLTQLEPASREFAAPLITAWRLEAYSICGQSCIRQSRLNRKSGGTG